MNGSQTDEKTLYNKYRKIIKDYILSKNSINNDIEDDVSDILIKIFDKLNNFDSNKSKFKSWVISITKNHLIDKWRCSTATTTQFSLDHTTFTSSQNIMVNNQQALTNAFDYKGVTFTNTSSTTCNLDYCSAITYISTQLSPTDFSLLNMKYMQGYNYDEIGREFQLTSSTVSNKINYIKTKLKKSMPEDIFD